MKKQETPKPGSKDYDPNRTEELTTPKYYYVNAKGAKVHFT